jgi:hypothetical protein
MKKLIPLILVAVTIMACSIIPTPKPEPTVFVPPVTEPPVTEPPATEPPIVPPVGVLVTCNELSFYLDPALATGFDCQTVPESPSEMELYPAHTKVILQGYPLADKFFEPQIMVYSVAAYTALAPTVIPDRVADLQTMVASGHNPLYKGTTSKAIPFLPTFNAGQAFYSKGKLQPFTSGIGVRFLTEFAQYFVPANNFDLFYTYQGVTTDGQYWVTAILPINHPILPDNAENPPGGMTWEAFTAGYETYIVDIVGQLNSRPPESFTPTLLALDALVTSITITP